MPSAASPIRTPLQVRASYLRNATGLIDLGASEERIRRRDLMVAGTAPGGLGVARQHRWCRE
jgi:hypothetical protein